MQADDVRRLELFATALERLFASLVGLTVGGRSGVVVSSPSLDFDHSRCAGDVVARRRFLPRFCDGLLQGGKRDLGAGRQSNWGVRPFLWRFLCGFDDAARYRVSVFIAAELNWAQPEGDLDSGYAVALFGDGCG